MTMISMIYDHHDCDHSDHDEHGERMVFDSSENAYKLGPYWAAKIHES